MKSVIIRGLLVAVAYFITSFALNIYDRGIEPQIGRHLAVQTVNGGDADFAVQQAWEQANTGHSLLWLIFAVVAFIFVAIPLVRQLGKASPATQAALLALFGLSVSMTGCMKEYNTPEYVEVKNNETAFVVPLEGDGGDQAKFQSEAFLQQKKVASKRIQISKRWNQTGRISNDGSWIPTIRVIIVDRSPVTREWRAPEGSSGKGAKADTAIWIESADSVGFSMGFNCTAYISEADSAKFLYMYAGNSLSQVMDSEIRARIQQVSAEVAAKYPLDELRTKKQEIADTVKRDTVQFFESRGITITTIGMFGGMTYENPKIQEAIDQTFVAQQAKVNTLAKLEAQKSENERIIQEAQAHAEASQREAEGRAKAYAAEAEGKAKAIQVETAALAAAQQNPAFLQLRQLEATKTIFDKWNGQFPAYYIGGPASVTGLLSLPSMGTPGRTTPATATTLP